MIDHYFTYFDPPFFDVLSFRKWIESIYTRDSMSSPWYNSTRFSLTRSMLFKSSCRHCPRNLCLRWAPYITNPTNHDASKWSTITFHAVSSDEHIGEMLHLMKKSSVLCYVLSHRVRLINSGHYFIVFSLSVSCSRNKYHLAIEQRAVLVLLICRAT